MPPRRPWTPPLRSRPGTRPCTRRSTSPAAEGKVPGRVEQNSQGRPRQQRSIGEPCCGATLTDAAKSDYSWSLPNPALHRLRSLPPPSIHSEGMETIAVIIDTSGSLPAATLAEFWAELREVAEEIRPESVVVLQVDAALQDAAGVTPPTIFPTRSR